MQRERFVELVKEALDQLPDEFRTRLHNVAVLVEDLPQGQREYAPRPRAMKPRKLLLGIFRGVPATQRSVFDLSGGPATIVLYQKNIEAVCRDDGEIRRQVLLTVMHEIGHFFGMTEEQLRDV